MDLDVHCKVCLQLNISLRYSENANKNYQYIVVYVSTLWADSAITARRGFKNVMFEDVSDDKRANKAEDHN